MIQLSFDDTCQENWQLNELLLEYNYKVVWFLDFREHDMAVEQINSFSAFKNYEIGNHTVNHVLLTRIPLDRAREEIAVAREKIKKLTGKRPTWFCPPRGYTNSDINKFVKLTGHKNVRLTDIHKQIHLYPRSEYGKMTWREHADKAIQKNGKLHVWGHAWEIEKLGLWDELKRFLNDYKNLAKI